MRVANSMSPDPITLPPQATIAEALDVMTRNSIHELPIVDGDRLVGIVTERDVRTVLGPASAELDVASIDDALLERTLDQVMTPRVAAIQLDEGMGEAARMLADLRVGALPVVDDQGHLVGILSITDVLAAAAPLFEQDE